MVLKFKTFDLSCTAGWWGCTD